MDEKKLKALAAELAKGLKTEADLNAFSRVLTKLTVETALNAELTDHLGHEKDAPKRVSNTRNGYWPVPFQLRLVTGSSTVVVVILLRQQGWFPGSTALVAGQQCWASASEVTKRFEHCWFNVPGYSYKNWSTSLVNWPTG